MRWRRGHRQWQVERRRGAFILQEILKARPICASSWSNAHNEYVRAASRKRRQVLTPGNLKLPFWIFNFEEIVDVLFGGRPGIEEEVEILAR